MKKMALSTWKYVFSSDLFPNEEFLIVRTFFQAHREWIKPMSVMSECTALLGWKSGVGGVSDSGFSSWAAPTYYCRSEYFYNQCPQVQNLIRTEHSLNRSECRVKSKAS